MLLKMGSYDISWSHDSLNKESSEVTELKIGTNVVQITLLGFNSQYSSYTISSYGIAPKWLKLNTYHLWIKIKKSGARIFFSGSRPNFTANFLCQVWKGPFLSVWTPLKWRYRNSVHQKLLFCPNELTNRISSDSDEKSHEEGSYSEQAVIGRDSGHYVSKFNNSKRNDRFLRLGLFLNKCMRMS